MQRNLASGIQAASADPRVLAASLTGMQRGAALGEQEAMQAQAQQQMQATLRRGQAEQQGNTNDGELVAWAILTVSLKT